MRMSRRWSIWYGLPAETGWPFYFYLKRNGYCPRFRAHLNGTVDLACRNWTVGQLRLDFAS